MKKIPLIALIFAFVSFFVYAAFGTALAQVDSNEQPAATTEEITIADLGVENPGLLPTNPFYFFKEWGRGIKMFFTFNKVSKAGYELEITNQKAAELKKVQEVEPNDIEALNKALDNYNENVEKLKARLQSLEETSANPNVDKLLNELVDRAMKHQQLFEELKAEREDINDKIENVQTQMVSVLQEVANRLDTPEKFKERLDSAVQVQKENQLKELRAIQFINKIEENTASPEVVEKLNELKEKQAQKIEEKLRSGSMDNNFKSELETIQKDVSGENAEKAFCIEVYDPVCGADNKTYSNSCFAGLAKVQVQYKGACAKSESNDSLKLEAIPQIKVSPDSIKIGTNNDGAIVVSRVWNVEITNEGFSLKELKIKKGDAVVWTNKGSVASWPASAIHPTHDVYPEKGGCISSAFDACKGLKTGETFKFVFNYVGSWKYHDHLNPTLTGTIIVE